MIQGLKGCGVGGSFQSGGSGGATCSRPHCVSLARRPALALPCRCRFRKALVSTLVSVFAVNLTAFVVIVVFIVDIVLRTFAPLCSTAAFSNVNPKEPATWSETLLWQSLSSYCAWVIMIISFIEIISWRSYIGDPIKDPVIFRNGLSCSCSQMPFFHFAIWIWLTCLCSYQGSLTHRWSWLTATSRWLVAI